MISLLVFHCADESKKFNERLGAWLPHRNGQLCRAAVKLRVAATIDSCNTSEGDPAGSSFAFTDVFY
jgi:hypothetical protein